MGIVLQEAAKPGTRAELSALLAGCGMHRPETALFSLTGPDRTRWLNGMVSNNIRDLAAGHGVYAFVLNPQGHIQGDLYAFNRGESLLLKLEKSQVEELMPLLRRYIIMDKVEVEELGEKLATLSVTGPKSKETLSAAGLAMPDFTPLAFAELSWNDVAISVIRGDNPYVENYELLIPVANIESVRAALVQAGAVEVEDDAVEMLRILSGIPKAGQDIGERTLPQETGQDRALNFTKGCYIGQEIVERIRARGAVHRMFTGFEIEGPAPVVGTKVQYEGKDVGEITTVAAAPLKQKRLALGYLRKDAMEPGRIFVAGEATVKAVPLPFTGIFH